MRCPGESLLADAASGCSARLRALLLRPEARLIDAWSGLGVVIERCEATSLEYVPPVTAAARQRRPATADDLARLPSNVAAEIIDGELVEKAMPSFEHGSAQLGLGAQLFGPYHRRPGGGQPGGWWLATEVEVQLEEGQVYRHDVVGWRRETTPARPSGSPILIRPDWVAEVLSPSSAGNDLVKKLRTLSKHGVPHDWIVDPEHRTLTVLRWTPDGYLTALTAEDHDVVRAEPFDATDLHVALLFGGGDPDR